MARMPVPTTMPAAASPGEFPAGPSLALPTLFPYGGADQDVPAFLEETDTAALLVLKDGELVFEQYWLTGGRDVQWLSMSVAKSCISAGIGIAVDEGLIDIQKAIGPAGSFIITPRNIIQKIKGIIIGNINCCESASLSTAEPIIANKAA